MDPDVSQPSADVPEENVPSAASLASEPIETPPELTVQDSSSENEPEAPDSESSPIPDVPTASADDEPEAASSSPAIANPLPSMTDPMVTATPSVAPNPPAVPAWDPHSAEEINFVKTVLMPKAIAARQAKARERIERLMELARKKGTIDRNDARLLLKVSQATATRYLTELVHEGRLVRKHIQNDNMYTVKQ